MRLLARRLLLLPVALAGLAIASTTFAASPDYKGLWKLILVGPFLENDLLLVDLVPHDGKIEAEVKEVSQGFPTKPVVGGVREKDGVLRFALTIGNTEAMFEGKPADDGIVYGLLKVNSQTIPSRLEPGKDGKLTPAPKGQPAIVQEYFALRSQKDAKVRLKKLMDMVAKKPGNPSMGIIYADILRSASPTLDEKEVRKVVDEWVGGAKPYGPTYVNELTTQAVLALAGKPAYANLAVDLASKAEAALPADASTQMKADLNRTLADAAKVAGKADLAASAGAKADKFEGELDEEYHKKVPPFKPIADAGPKDRKSKRVVLMELFTGAQCPPCVAADVAFDALITSYKPSELVTLQYHLHIPGPDPLTNADSEERVKYYPNFQGTPTTFFDGQSEAGGGGGMPNAKAKYEEFRRVVDGALAKPSLAAINLKVSREGDAIKIHADAMTEKGAGSNLKLRLVLVEEQVRYTGGNGLRFHHHVVRSFPGGVAGKALEGGNGEAEATVKIADLRKSLEAYLSESEKSGNEFPKALPPIDLGKLSVVAFVQNDDNRNVLNAVVTDVAAAK